MNTADASGTPWQVRFGWALCALAWLAPFFVVFGFVRPNIGQAYYLQTFAALALGTLASAWLLGAWRPVARVDEWSLWLVGLILGLIIISALRARDPAFALNAALAPLAAGGLWFCLINLPNREAVLRRMSIGYCAVALLLAGYGVLQHFGFEFLPYSEVVRKNMVIATIGHPNYLGSVLGPMLFVLAGLILAHPRRRIAWIAPAGAMLILFCLALARTRAIWVGMGLSFILFIALGVAFARTHRGGIRRVRLMLAGAGLQLLALVLLIVLVVPRLSEYNLVERFTSDKEIKSRLFYWDTALELGKLQPLLGHGYGMFNALFWETTEQRLRSPGGRFYEDILPSISGIMPGHAHNEYVEIFCEQGWLGVALVLAAVTFFLVFGARAVLRQLDTMRAFELLGCWAGLSVSVVDAFFGFPWRLPISLLVITLIGARLHIAIYPNAAELAAQSTEAVDANQIDLQAEPTRESPTSAT